MADAQDAYVMQHLADFIEEEMRERGWDIDRLVMEMGPHFSEEEWAICKLSWEMFFSVRTPDILLGDVMANQLEVAFGASPQFFINFHEIWRNEQNSAKLPDPPKEP